MYKAKYSDVQQLIKYGKDNEVVARMVEIGLQPSGHVIAYYTPSGANWAYQIGIYKVNGDMYELVTRFGSVEGGRRVFTGDDKVAQ